MQRRKAVFTDWDEMREALAGWDLSRFIFTDRNRPFRGSVDAYFSDSVSIVRTSFNRQLLQHGASPEGHHTFAFMRSSSAPGTFMRHPADGKIAAMGDREFQGSCAPGLDVYTVALNADWLAAAEATTPVMQVRNFSRSNQVLEVSDRDHQTMQNFLQAVLDGTSHLDSPNPACTEAVPRDFVDRLGTLSLVETESSPIPSTRDRRRALSWALEFIEGNLNRALTIGEICREAATSERVLEYAFREYAGVTPKGYLDARRLHAFRHALQTSKNDDGVTDTAGHFDFWHMGKLARDYRAKFGERPSTTLVRHRHGGRSRESEDN